tara:strand:- start:194278 stop:195387 length:1110 start_codon:yes stop_codon:yes gene_type:complete
MNTSAINNPLPILPSANNGKQMFDANNDSGAFSQALTQEISNRNDGSKNSNDANKDVSKNSGGDKTNNDGSKTKSADDAKATDKTTGADKKTADKDDDATVDNPAAGIMAFVAHLTQNHKATTNSAADAKLTLTDKLKAGADQAVDAAKADLTAGTDDKGKSAKQDDFLTVLSKATTGTTEGGKVNAGTQAAETFAPLLAASSQTMAPNSTALQRANELQNMQANTFSQQVGGADWDKALGQKVVWMVQGAQTSATMTLNPPDLGPMQITLNVNNNQATASFIAHHPEVRNALENAMPRLREMLGDAGIQLGQSNVSAGTSDQQAAFESGRQSSGRNGGTSETGGNETPLHVSHVPTPAATDGTVDTFA